MEDFIAAYVFVIALSILVVYTAAVLKPFIFTNVVEVPIAPSKELPTRHIYVYSSVSGLYAVEYEGLDVEEFRKAMGVPGALVAIFEVYPGGYRCVNYANYTVKLGPDPYTGLWCPPPFKTETKPYCIPIGITSRGRWLLVQYRCP
ncbi:conserved hypothetical protein [Pyrobaculum islandicum DSM 4184]|uniref:Uncharacterized protein n=1 Tax=Pyrobaculum islandicum (strain DSM 4184 / JCM 9189 / GEO3) TaxID=384616 RepID=A1RSW8_PYRIL|nr:hypothetical protein [Pyrobaculum islandicum]ABL88050.1 conserved hypothetical protein [Pyrobaculum islandicum DSM 4184]